MKALSPFEQFAKDLGADDETGLVIRTHAHIESGLRHYIDCAVSFPEHLPKLTYDAVVRLACALGFDAAHLGALRGLGALRNYFGHRHDAKLTEKNVNELLSAFGERRQLVISTYQDLRATERVSGPQTFDALHPYNKFVVVALCLRALIDNELEDLQDSKSRDT